MTPVPATVLSAIDTEVASDDGKINERLVEEMIRNAIGIGFVPPLWQPELVNEIQTVSTEEARVMARRLARRPDWPHDCTMSLQPSAAAGLGRGFPQIAAAVLVRPAACFFPIHPFIPRPARRLDTMVRQQIAGIRVPSCKDAPAIRKASRVAPGVGGTRRSRPLITLRPGENHPCC